MLTGIRIVFLGGDARQIEVIRKCVEMDATVSAAGFDKWDAPSPGVSLEHMSAELLSRADVLVLPTVGCDDEGNINALLSTERLQLLEEHIAALPPSCMVYTGMAKSYLRGLCDKYSLKLVELLSRDDVAIYNSIPTAEGALVMAIQNTDFTIHGSTSMVLGMGRTGFTMARVLQGLGSNVKVGVRKQEHYARAEEMGWKPFMTGELVAHAPEADLIFNTIPSMIITAQVLSRLPRHCVIIDLASAPGGCDFRYAEKRGIKAMLAPGLPGVVAPKSAGIIMAGALVQSISDETFNRGDV
ncbi:dipicolinate synthase subunit DpsA [Paenibacillus sonchi]|uniref:Dipicolinate synthase subunit DpsA n=1 Tax=Paenibacillus sonchi TaxID=373687 RepID=A0A974PA75_9BACL|nr:dipicolinate synthase subunit DpsA [Paenibacillus sonchi]MCE3201487.1 dipicolinate synthase subunit DpsA [Paenibacillus sonchi]QQZ60287.1 dipicolinate synthase subunit DpsA [Paenibacillus sonchi]